MVERYWPAGICDIPLRESITYSPRYLGQDFQTESGEVLSAIRVTDAGIDMTATYVMSNYEFGIFQLWWLKETKGGILPFWLRDPKLDTPYRWRIQPGQVMQVVGNVRKEEELVTLPLLRLPS
jgi:hypothetical protein